MKLVLLNFLLFACGLMGAKIFPYPYIQKDLPNGLRVVTIPTEYPNIVALVIVVQTGSRNEVEPGKSGFAHLFEHLMFRGTKEFPPDKYQAALKNAGAAANAFTTDDFTAYHATFSKEDLPAVLHMEADRFEHLQYDPAAFKTETLAVLGEYNKNSASPVQKLFEKLRDTAFQEHTYKHTTMGFLQDVQNMPQEYDYSLTFFQRYYRPEYTTIIVAGDVDPKSVQSLVEKDWGSWKAGSYKPDIPAEPPQVNPRTAHVDWPTPTLPYVAVSYRSPAYSDEIRDLAALDAIGALGFSPSSDLYRKLVIQEQKVDLLVSDNRDHVDPALFTILARVKKPEDLETVQNDILTTVKSFSENAVEADRLERVKSNLRYSFALRMNNSEAIAQTVASYVALRRTPETINRLYDLYAKLTPADLERAARKYLTPNNRTIVTLTGAKSK
ncbi:MAG: insulinase family protein [Acidobacteriota bacterium]|nr:insulinase family protein [Acidobacteriota bacterium]